MDLNNDKIPEGKEKEQLEMAHNVLPQGDDYDVFSENSNEKIDSLANASREYLDAMYKGDLSFDDTEIVMTRSQYISDVTRLEEHYKKERQGQIKLFGVALAVLLLVPIVDFVFGNAINAVTTYMYFDMEASNWGQLLGLGRRFLVWSLRIISAVIAFSAVKRLIKMKKSYKYSLARLEQRKQELMLLGQYDSAN